MSGQGTRFPTVPFNATIWAIGEIPVPSNAEIVRVTNIVGDVLTITRAQEGSSARSVIIGDQIAATITAKTLTDIETAFAGTNGAITAGSITVNSSGVSVNVAPHTASAAAGSFSFGTLSFSNANGVTFGTSAGPAITASVATSLTNINLSAGTTSTNASAFTFSNANGISFGLDTGANAGRVTATYTVPIVTAGSDTLGMSNLGNTSGTSGVVSGDSVRVLFAGGNNITLSQSINGVSATITISGANAGGAQTGISGIVVSDTTYTSGTVSFSNAGNITISSSVNGATQYIRLSGNAAQTNQSAIKGFGVSNTGQTAGNTGISTGIDWVLAGSQSITLSQSTAGGGPDTIWIQHPAWITTADLSANSSKYVQNWKLTGNTAGTTSSAQGTDLWFSGGNSITVSGSSNSIVFSVGNYITTAALSGDTTKYVQNWKLTGNTAGTTSSAQGTDLWFSGGANVTVSGSSNTIVISAAAGGGGAFTGGMSNLGNTSGTSGTVQSQMLVVGGNNITISQSINGQSATLTVSAFNQSNQSVGLYAVGNTTQNSSTTLDARTISFNAIGGATWGYSNGSVQVSVPASSSLTASSPIGLSSNGSTITVSAIPMSNWDPFNAADAQMLTNSTLGNSTLYFNAFDLPFVLSASRINFFVSIATTSSNAASSGSGSMRLGYAIYSQGTGTASDRISQVTSYSAAYISYTSSSSSQLGATILQGVSNATSHSTTTTALSTSNASTFMANSIGGFRAVPLPVGLTLTPGRYWIGISHQTTNNAAASFKVDATVMQQSVTNQIAFRPMGTSSAASNASVFGIIPAVGTYSAQSAGWPNTIPLTASDIRMALTATLPYFNFSGFNADTSML